jgi:ABC-type branched-subunit amino acid transport system ATPase component/predicted MFS family arabinose efflux permease
VTSGVTSGVTNQSTSDTAPAKGRVKGLGPAIALSCLALVHETDQAAYGLLGPEIVRTFRVSPTTFGLIVIPTVLLGLSLPILVGWLTDRVDRVKLAVGGAILWALCASLAGLAPTFAVFVLARILASVGRAISGPTHNTLIADIYPVERRGVAFSLHQNAHPVGDLVGLLAGGLIATLFAWQTTFLVLPLLAIPPLLWVARIRDPNTEGRRARAAEPDGEQVEPVGLRTSLRLLQNVVSFRRYSIVWFLLAVGSAMSSVYSFYFDAVFGLGPLQRGAILGTTAVLTIVGSVVGGRWGQSLIARGETRRLGNLLVWSIGAFAVTLLATAFAPNALLAAAIVVCSSPLRALAAIPVLLVLSATVPARMRGVAFGALTTCFALGLLALPIALAYGNKYSYRVSLLIGVVPTVIAGIIAFMTSSSIAGDIARAERVGSMEERAAARRRSGERSGVLEVSGLDVSYGTVQVLFDVSLHLDEGEMLALLGTNGAGKSTLLKAVCGLTRPSAGAVLLDGRDVTSLDAEALAARGIALVPGGKGVFPGLSVERNLRLGSWLHRKDREASTKAMDRALELFPRLGERLAQPAGTLSGGEQQMLTLAQAFISGPRILAIDELSLGLAPLVVEELLQTVEAINATGVSVILVEQSVNIALSLTQRAVFMEKGEIRYEGPSRELLERDDLVRSVFLAQPAGVGS